MTGRDILIRIVIAIHDSGLRRELQAVLARPDILVQVPRARKDLWEWIVREPADVLIISQSFLPALLKNKIHELQSQPDSPAVVVLSDSADPKEHAKLMAQECDAVLFNGLAAEQICDVIEAILGKRKRLKQKSFFTPQPLGEAQLADFVSQSPRMADFMNVVPRVVQSNTPLLIEGETGVGKERLASAIHKEGPRAAGRFVALNCGALPEQLLESELFGHVRGAFTGATAARRGWFELAHQGTLFLDEISEIPVHLQVKLLRVLQEKEVQPVGSEKSFTVDVRVIAASNRSLAHEIEAGRFRKDLYHRLSVVTICIPPLRERPEDIPVLVERHIHAIARQLGRRVTGINPQAVQAMRQYPWPGNVRELNNVIERAILLCDDTEIILDDLPESIAAATSEQTAGVRVVFGKSLRAASPGVALKLDSSHRLQLPEQWLAKPLHEMRETFLFDLERQYIEGVLIAARGRVGLAAKKAGIRERSLYEKMRQHGLRKEDFRQHARNKHTGADKKKQ